MLIQAYTERGRWMLTLLHAAANITQEAKGGIRTCRGA